MNTPTRSISTDKPLPGVTAGRATNLVVENQGKSIKILRLEGYCYATANTQYWLHLFPQATVPANGVRPIAKWQMLGLNGFTYEFASHGFNPQNAQDPIDAGDCIIVASSTEDTLTVFTGAGNNISLRVDIEEYELEIEGLSVAGDRTTPAAALQVWAQAAGPKHLYQLFVVDQSGAASYIQVYADDATLNKMIAGPVLLPASGTVKLVFGTDFVPFSTSAAGVATQGCNVNISTLPTTPAGDGSATIEARYF